MIDWVKVININCNSLSYIYYNKVKMDKLHVKVSNLVYVECIPNSSLDQFRNKFLMAAME